MDPSSNLPLSLSFSHSFVSFSLCLDSSYSLGTNDRTPARFAYTTRRLSLSILPAPRTVSLASPYIVNQDVSVNYQLKKKKPRVKKKKRERRLWRSKNKKKGEGEETRPEAWNVLDISAKDTRAGGRRADEGRGRRSHQPSATPSPSLLQQTSKKVVTKIIENKKIYI